MKIARVATTVTIDNVPSTMILFMSVHTTNPCSTIKDKFILSILLMKNERRGGPMIFNKGGLVTRGMSYLNTYIMLMLEVH